MFWHQKWSALSARIQGLVEAGQYLSTALTRGPGDSFGIVRRASKELVAIVDELDQFNASHGAELPSEARTALDQILVRDWFTGSSEQINENLVAVGALITFRARFEYAIQDHEVDARNRTDLAFEHLRRSILLDNEINNKCATHLRTVAKCPARNLALCIC